MADIPDFVIGGAARSGTTLLCHVLARHPSISICEPKEPHFLAYPNQPLRFTGPGDAETINLRSVTDSAIWRGLFAGHEGLMGDGSVTVLYEYDNSIPAIKKYCPDAKLAFILREPVDRAFSAYQWLRSRGYEDLSFLDALEAEEQRKAEGYQHIWHYASGSRYAAPLEAFRSEFPKNQLHVMFYENLLADPAGELTRLQHFLGVEPVAESLDIELRVNSSGTPRSGAITAFYKKLSMTPALRNTVRRAVPYPVRERIRTSLLRSETLSADMRTAAARHIGPIRDLDPEGPAPEWLTSPCENR